MKNIIIKIKLNDKNIGYLIEDSYDKNNIREQLELLGVIETTADIIRSRINTLIDVRN